MFLNFTRLLGLLRLLIATYVDSFVYIKHGGKFFSNEKGEIVEMVDDPKNASIYSFKELNGNKVIVTFKGNTPWNNQVISYPLDVNRAIYLEKRNDKWNQQVTIEELGNGLTKMKIGNLCLELKADNKLYGTNTCSGSEKQYSIKLNPSTITIHKINNELKKKVLKEFYLKTGKDYLVKGEDGLIAYSDLGVNPISFTAKEITTGMFKILNSVDLVLTDLKDTHGIKFEEEEESDSSQLMMFKSIDSSKANIVAFQSGLCLTKKRADSSAFEECNNSVFQEFSVVNGIFDKAKDFYLSFDQNRTFVGSEKRSSAIIMTRDTKEALKFNTRKINEGIFQIIAPRLGKYLAIEKDGSLILSLSPSLFDFIRGNENDVIIKYGNNKCLTNIFQQDSLKFTDCKGESNNIFQMFENFNEKLLKDSAKLKEKTVFINLENPENGYHHQDSMENPLLRDLEKKISGQSPSQKYAKDGRDDLSRNSKDYPLDSNKDKENKSMLMEGESEKGTSDEGKDKNMGEEHKNFINVMSLKNTKPNKTEEIKRDGNIPLDHID